MQFLQTLLGFAVIAGIVYLGAELFGTDLNRRLGDSGPEAFAWAGGGVALALLLWLRRVYLMVRYWQGWRFRAWLFLAAGTWGLYVLVEPMALQWLDAGTVRPARGIGTGLTGLVFYAVTAWALHARLPNAGQPQVERGSAIVEAADVQRELWGKKHKPGPDLIRLGGLDIPPNVEAKHFMLCGSTGSGKTQAIQRVLDAVRARGGRLLAADSGGEFFSRYAGGGDGLLNPFDGRSVAWSPFAEIEADYDCQRIAKSAIPDREGAGGEWNHYAQTLLAEALLALHKAGEPSVETLLHVLTAASRSELETLLSGTPAAVLASDGNDRMLASTRSIIATYLGAWRYLPDRGDFSIRQWVRDEASGGWLFATYRDDQMALLRHMIAGWIDLALIEALTLPENGNRQLWFVFDECDSLGKIGSLDQGLAKLRKYGGRCVVGCQTVAQLRSTYGRDTAQTIAANAANKLILRAGDHETAEYFSRTLGEQDIARQSVSRSESTRADQIGTGSTSESTSVQRTKRAAVLPAELMDLPDLAGFLSLAGMPGVIRLALEYRAVEQRLPGFLAEAPAPEPVTTPEVESEPDPEASAPAG